MKTTIILESLIAGLATLVGAAMVCGFGRPRVRWLAAFMGFAAGVMAFVVLLDLLPYSYSYGSLLYTAVGFWLGAFLMKILKAVVQRLANRQTKNQEPHFNRFLQLGILVAIGIALHDLPEGMAIAAGHQAHNETGIMLALAIGLHNIPEGIATATPFIMAGTKRWKIVLLMLLISLFTPLGAGIGLLLLSLGEVLISLLLALAAGAMISLVIHDLLPEAWHTNKKASLLGFVSGCILMIYLTLYLHF